MRSIVPNCGASTIRRYYFTLIRVRVCVCVCVCVPEKSHEIGGHTSMVHGVLQEGARAMRRGTARQ